VSINRVPEIPFAQIANSALRDRRLSFKARGLLAMVLSHSGEWQATAEWLEAQSEPDGRHTIQTALNELTALGYRAVRRERLPDGRVQTLVDWFHEPLISRPTENPTDGLSDRRKTGASIEHYSSEHNKEEHNERTPVRKPVDTPEFDKFWQAYPRRAAKGAARRAWSRVAALHDPAVVIAAAAQYAVDPRRDPQFTPHPATWLNSERWLDEAPPAAAPSGPVVYMDQVADEPCPHGDPRGVSRCAICRIGK